MVIVLRKILILCSVLKERSLVAFVAGRAKISDIIMCKLVKHALFGWV
jgi:hypothetical protein